TTARQLLSALQTTYTATNSPQRGSTGATALTIGLAFGDGGIVCTPATSCMGEDPLCMPASLSVGLDLTFKTADGTFDETFVATASFVNSGPNMIWSGS